MSVTLIVLLSIVSLSALVAALIVRGKSVEQAVKWMLFVGYFWLLAFAQLMMAALVYWWSKHSGQEWFL